MLVTKTVKVRWNFKLKKYYKEKGYIYTKDGDEFNVKVEDLHPKSGKYVELMCDGCGKTKEITWGNYKERNEPEGVYYCKTCNHFNSFKKILQTKLKNSISFEQWCFDNLSENEAKKILTRWDIEKNKLLPSDVPYTSNGLTKKGYWFKCDINPTHESELKLISSFVTRKKNNLNCTCLDCLQCNSFGQYLLDIFGENGINTYWDYDLNVDKDGNKIDPFKISKCSGKRVYIKCQKKDYHKSYFIICRSFINGGRCPHCGHGAVHKLDSLGQLLEDKQLLHLWSNKNLKSPYDYTCKSGIKVFWKCHKGKHEDYERNIQKANLLHYRCAECQRERSESYIQEDTRLYLNTLNYTILHEYNCKIIPINPKTNYGLPFDNEIKELKLICEVMGSQHYEITNFTQKSATAKNITPEEELEYQQWKDKYKQQYALAQGYNYIALPYWTYDDKETWKQLLNDKIKEILSKS